MQIPAGQNVTITYYAWDSGTNQGKTGDAGNHTIRFVRDGTEVIPFSSPSEINAVTLQGHYRQSISASELAGGLFYTVGGQSSSIGVRIIPISFSVD